MHAIRNTSVNDRDEAAVCEGLFAIPINTVSAILYIIVISWLIIVGIASVANALGTGIRSNSSLFSSIFILPFLNFIILSF